MWRRALSPLTGQPNEKSTAPKTDAHNKIKSSSRKLSIQERAPSLGGPFHIKRPRAGNFLAKLRGDREGVLL